MNDKSLIKVIMTGIALTFSLAVNAQSIHVAPSGFVGFGTTLPEAELHVVGAIDRVNLIIENKGVGAAKMNLKNSEANWLFNSNSTLRITTGGNIAEFLLWPTSGNLEIRGTLITGGVTCGGGGCDLVFSPETERESIEAHAAQMWTNSYLPAVGPTVENMPMNLSEKTGGMLNELEMAHIYIEQLHHRLATLEAEQEEIKLMVTSLLNKGTNDVLLTSVDFKQ